MTSPPNKLLREIWINGTGLLVPLSFYAGYCFGETKYVAGFIALGVYLLIDNIMSRIFWRMIGRGK